ARAASATSLRVRATGTVAGATSRAAPAREMASTAAPRAERHTISGVDAGSRATTAPGIQATRAATRSGSTIAGAHRIRYRTVVCPDPVPVWPLLGVERRRVGIIQIGRAHV